MARKYLARNVAIGLLIIGVAGAVLGVYWSKRALAPERQENSSEETQVESNQIHKEQPPTSPAPQESNNGLVYPIAGFPDRVTKKPFGIYVSPQDSPVQPERFTGYHTAVDVEYEDVSDDVPVFAINDCEVVISRIAQGYGGVFIINTEIDGSDHSVIYGHIRPSSLPQANAEYKKGAQIGFLGTGYSSETDGERRHLHFGVLTDSGTDLRGYVQNKDELSGWLDPATIF